MATFTVYTGRAGMERSLCELDQLIAEQSPVDAVEQFFQVDAVVVLPFRIVRDQPGGDIAGRDLHVDRTAVDVGVPIDVDTALRARHHRGFL